MNKEVLKAGHQEPADKSKDNYKKISTNRCKYLRGFLSYIITEEILLRRFGYRYFEEVPENLYIDIKKSLFSLRSRLAHDRATWENSRKAKGLDYVYRPEPVYENNRRVF
jgi:hypothetical protein